MDVFDISQSHLDQQLHYSNDLRDSEIFQFQNQQKPVQGLSIREAAFAFICTVIGCGIVSQPYALMQGGFLFCLFQHIFMMHIILLSSYLQFKAKDYLGYEQFGELAYICFGRPSVFIINFMISFGCFWTMVMYMLLFGKTFSSLFITLQEYLQNENVLTTVLLNILNGKNSGCLFIYIFLFPIVLKKKLREFKFAIYLLLGGMISLNVIFIIKNIYKDEEQLTNEFQSITLGKHGYLDSVSIIMSDYSLILTLFPIYNSLQVKSNANGLKAVSMALIICFILNFSFANLAYAYYGNHLSSCIFDNFTLERGYVSVLIRILFSIIFLCNTPYIFFAGKECLLVIIDEAMFYTISKSLKKNIEAGNLSFQAKQNLYKYKTLNIEIIPINETQEDKQSEHSLKFQTQFSKKSSISRKSNDSYVMTFENYSHQSQLEHFKQPQNEKKLADRVGNKIYYSTVIILFTLELIFSILINDVTIIIGFDSANIESNRNFVLPPLLYIMSCKISGVKPNKILQFLCYFLLTNGILLFVVLNYYNIWKFF